MLHKCYWLYRIFKFAPLGFCPTCRARQSFCLFASAFPFSPILPFPRTILSSSPPIEYCSHWCGNIGNLEEDPNPHTLHYAHQNTTTQWPCCSACLWGRLVKCHPHFFRIYLFVLLFCLYFVISFLPFSSSIIGLFLPTTPLFHLPAFSSYLFPSTLSHPFL